MKRLTLSNQLTFSKRLTFGKQFGQRTWSSAAYQVEARKRARALLDTWLWIGAVAILALMVAGYRPARRAWRRRRDAQARGDFRLHREHLEARFVELASSSGKPRWLRWASCDFEDEVVYARDRTDGSMAAFVGVTVSFAAIAGGLMEDVEAVGNLRAATAVFQFHRGRWNTQGRCIFNLSPTQTIAFYQGQLEPVS